MRFADIQWPAGGRTSLRNAKVPACLLADAGGLGVPDGEGCLGVDVLIEQGRIARITPPGTVPDDGGDYVDLGGRQLWPTLIDIHTHLDKGHTVERSPNSDGTFGNARNGAMADRPNWTPPDLRRRMGFGLKTAYAHGVSAIRTHIDTYPETLDRSWPVVREMREEWAGRIALKAVSLCPIDTLMDDYGDRVASVVAQSGGLLGGVTRPSVGLHGTPAENMDAQLDRLFTLAQRHDLDVDLHVDETGDPAADSLPFIARAALRHGYKGRVVCGHCCSLAVQPEAQVDRTLDLLAEAGVAIITLPTVNMYLQDRQAGRTPRWRGVTVVHEMLKRGIRVAAAGDNVRDSFYAYGDHDVVDTFREAVRILHFDHPLTAAPSLVGATPSAIGKLDGIGAIKVGAEAKLIIFNAFTVNQIVSRPQSDRIVIDRGARLTAPAPGYDELETTAG